MSTGAKAREREAARLRMARRRETPAYRQWLDESRERRAAFKRKYRRQKSKNDAHVKAYAAWVRGADERARRKAWQQKADARKFFAALGMKLCPVCKTLRRMDDFAEKKMSADGRNGRCKSCDVQRSLSRRKADPLVRVQHNLSNRIRSALRSNGFSKSSNTQEILGCDFAELRAHLEKQFTRGMSWSLMGREIHVDHIVPIASAITEDDLLRLNHFTNLRPMWARDNQRKGARREHLL